MIDGTAAGQTGSPDARLPDGWLSTDHFRDVCASLEMLEVTLSLVGEQPAFWKWAIIAAHSGLQGACVCILTGTNRGGAFRPNHEKALLRFQAEESRRATAEPRGAPHDSGDIEYPRLEVAPLPELLRRLPDDLRVQLPKEGYETRGTLEHDLRLLHDLRNQFVHFEPKDVALEIAGLARIVGRALDLTDRIATSDAYGRRNRFAREVPVADVIDRCREALDHHGPGRSAPG